MHTAFRGIEPLKVSGRTDFAAFTPLRGCHAMPLAWHFSFALLKQCLPGPYTFIMEASGSVPRNYQNANKTIGIRVPENDIARAIIEEVGCPLICTSVRPLGEEDEPENYCDPELIHERFGSRVDVVVDGGIADTEPSTVIDCSDGIELVRQGKGPYEG